jgi:hypothetical protein
MASTLSTIDLAQAPASPRRCPPIGTYEPDPDAWAKAAEGMARWRQIFDEEEAAALGAGCSNDQAYDHGQVAAWLDSHARNRRLHVQRYFPDSGRITRHRVEILLENEEGETYAVECGGRAFMEDLKRAGDTDWLYKRQEIGEGWVRIELMITDRHPDHEMFTRADGKGIDLGFNDSEHYYTFLVEIHQDDLFDNY